MSFVPLYYGDKIKIINSNGYVGVITLWSKVDFVIKRFEEQNVDLNPETSPIVAIGNLYGNGLKQLLRNLLYNPKITHLCVCGKNRSGSLEELINFFQFGVEDFTALGIVGKRVIGTKRILDNLINPDLFKITPDVVYIGDLISEDSLQKANNYFNYLKPIAGKASKLDRIELELPKYKVNHYPSNPRSHTIVKDTPIEAWKELVFRIIRFGHLVSLKKGDRQELQNVKIVVEKPIEEHMIKLEKYGFELWRFKEYQKEIMNPEPPIDDTSYTYGNRIRRYFDNIDSLQECINRINEDHQDRQCFVSLWDTNKDLAGGVSNPCLVSLYFRVFEDKMNLTASFRTHNALDAWLENFYGLMMVLNYVSKKTGLESGSITVFSHSITISVEEYERAKGIAGEKRLEIELDPNGYFQINVEDKVIVVRHFYDGILIDEYREKKAEKLQLLLYRNQVVSDIGHAMYLGREIARAENCLLTGKIYIQK